MSKKILLSLILIILIFLILGKLFKNYAADYFYKQSQTLIKNGDYEKSIKYADYSIKLNPQEPNYYRGRAKVLLPMLQLENSTYQKKYEIKKLVLDNLVLAYQLNPQNLVIMRNSIPIYYFISTLDLTKPYSPENIDENFSVHAKTFYTLLKQKYPNDLGVLVDIAKYEKRLGFVDEHKKTIEMITILRPDVLEWHEDLK